MNAQPFIGDADGPQAAIDKADDGTPFADCRGWTCWYCERLYSTVAEAEACCTRPAPVRPDHVVEG